MSGVGAPWAATELAMMDGFVRAGIHAGRCHHLFPDRTPQAVSSKFNRHRAELGLPAPAAGAPTPAPKPRDRRKPAFVVSTAPMQEPKPCTKYTDEADACRRLLRRQLETGAHWLHGELFLEACKLAGLGAE